MRSARRLRAIGRAKCCLKGLRYTLSPHVVSASAHPSENGQGNPLTRTPFHCLRERPIFICGASRCAWVWDTTVHVFGNEAMLLWVQGCGIMSSDRVVAAQASVPTVYLPLEAIASKYAPPRLDSPYTSHIRHLPCFQLSGESGIENSVRPSD